MMSENTVIYDLQAKLCQTLGQSVRLRIINLLKYGPQCVTSIARNIGVPQPTVSRHLTVLRTAGILTRQRKGAEVFYEITSPKIVEVCEMMREILTEQELHHLEIFNILKE
jgi:ArsR family transcriptional regulator, virulence genes transcriptional regulator